jgi:hypothetical protein
MVLAPPISLQVWIIFSFYTGSALCGYTLQKLIDTAATGKNGL